MKVATFNINHIRNRLANLLLWLDREQPDVVCLQELKTEQDSFPFEAIEAAGYQSAWVGEKSWNGVAILARGAEPIPTRLALPGDQNDRQARYLEAAVRGILVGCLYLPNGNPQPSPKFTYKLSWFDRLLRHAEDLLSARVPVVLAGDYNVVPDEQDIYATRSLDKNALVQPASRQKFKELLAQGWTDSLRRFHPTGPLWTFWDYKLQRWEANKGMRLDHLLLSPQLAPSISQAGVDRWVRGENNASDHAPAWVILKS